MGGTTRLNAPAYQLRFAQSVDAAACAALDRDHSPVFAQTSSYARLIDGEGCVLLCEQGTRLVGVAALANGVDAAELLNLVVEPSMRRQGCAFALLRHACVWARDQERSLILLEIRASNIAARLLYEQSGFRVDGVRARYYLDTKSGLREDAILMSKDLTGELKHDDTDT